MMEVVDPFRIALVFPCETGSFREWDAGVRVGSFVDLNAPLGKLFHKGPFLKASVLF